MCETVRNHILEANIIKILYAKINEILGMLDTFHISTFQSDIYKCKS